jgi:hypothetical protein
LAVNPWHTVYTNILVGTRQALSGCPVRYDPNNRSLIATMAAAQPNLRHWRRRQRRHKLVTDMLLFLLSTQYPALRTILRNLPSVRSHAADTPFGGIFVRQSRLFSVQPAPIGTEKFWRYGEM